MLQVTEGPEPLSVFSDTYQLYFKNLMLIFKLQKVPMLTYNSAYLKVPFGDFLCSFFGIESQLPSCIIIQYILKCVTCDTSITFLINTFKT